MPLRLVSPRQGRSPNHRIRGTHFGTYVDRTSGTSDRTKARKILKKIERDIETGIFVDHTVLTFAQAALSYLQAGVDDRFMRPLVEHFRTRAVFHIDQVAIDDAAAHLYPSATPATRNRQVYTPVSAILKHVGVDKLIKRPKGSPGNKRTRWLTSEQAFAVFEAAHEVDPEFAVLLLILCYSGLRISEGLSLEWNKVWLEQRLAYLPDSKNGDPRPNFLTDVAKLREHPAGLERRSGRLFRFSKTTCFRHRLSVRVWRFGKGMASIYSILGARGCGSMGESI